MSTNPTPPQLPAPRLPPLSYAELRRQVVKDTLAAIPEPLPGERPELFPNTRERLDKWTEALEHGEAQIRRSGSHVNVDLLRMVVQLRFNRTLIYWRLFRLMDLPPEIITNIFHLIVWSTSHSWEGVKQRLDLTWVCRAWRRLMIEDPLIWNAIWFHDRPPYERSWEWFKRAGSSRLDIRLNEVDPMYAGGRAPPKFTAQQMSDLLDKLFTKLSQIRMLVIVVDNWPPALTVLQKLQAAGDAGTPINIERLEIHRSGLPYVWIGPGFNTEGHRDPAVLFGGQTRRLRYLCLSGVHIDFNDTPLSNLTTLDLRHIAMDSSPTLRRFREILQNCPNLDRLTLDGCGPQLEDRRFDHTPVELPKLRVLTLGSFSLQFACYIIAQVNAPRVRDLTLMKMSGSDYIPLISGLTRRFKQVRILTLYNLELAMNRAGKRTFIRWLESMPEIGYARVAGIRPEVLNMFAEDPTKYRVASEGEPTTSEAGTPAHHVLCPKFQCMEVQALQPEKIADFCRLRKDVGVPMKKLYLNTPWMRELTPQDIKLLQQEAVLYVAPTGSNTEEEDRLLSDGWDV